MTSQKHSSHTEQKPRTIVISQPMYFPWVGQLEQFRAADTFVFYDDVQFARNFFNRVQIKTPTGSRWLTAPLSGRHQTSLINEIHLDESRAWRADHLKSIQQAYRESPFLDDAMDIASHLLNKQIADLATLSITSTLTLAKYFCLDHGRNFVRSSELGVHGHGTQRLIDLCIALRGNRYLTGHGAANYLDHEAFELRGISVSYIKYGCTPYPQQHGPFTPYVSALDLVANCGPEGRQFIQGEQISWREFLASRSLDRARAHP